MIELYVLLAMAPAAEEPQAEDQMAPAVAPTPAPPSVPKDPVPQPAQLVSGNPQNSTAR